MIYPPLPKWTAALPPAQRASIRVYAERCVREALARAPAPAREFCNQTSANAPASQ